MRKLVIFDGAHNFLFVLSAVAFVMAVSSGTFFYFSGWNFTVINFENVCELPLNNRCFKRYQIKNADGKTENFVPSGYNFGKTDLAIGNHLRKNRKDFEFLVNDNKKTFEYLDLHIGIVLLSIFGMVLWQLLSRKLSPRD